MIYFPSKANNTYQIFGDFGVGYHAGELIEFGSSFLFLLILAFPLNFHIFSFKNRFGKNEISSR